MTFNDITPPPGFKPRQQPPQGTPPGAPLIPQQHAPQPRNDGYGAVAMPAHQSRQSTTPQPSLASPATPSPRPQTPPHSLPPDTSTPESLTSQPPERPYRPKKSHQGLRDLLSVAGVIVGALLLAFTLISFVFQSYQVDGPSMQTTLQNNDHLIVWKVPRTIARITGHTYIPQRGDVIVFNEPNLAELGATQNKQLIKRVIGLPGDHVVVRNGIITIINKDHPEGFQPDKTLPYGNVIPLTPLTDDRFIGQNEVYVCGDNRPNSLDSRTFGPVAANDIVGKLVARILPLSTFKKF